DRFEEVPRSRAEVLRELIRFHRIDAIFSHGWCADRLVHKVTEGLDLAWFIDLRNRAVRCDVDSAEILRFDHLNVLMMMRSRGVFYSGGEDLRMFVEALIPRPERLIRLDDGQFAVRLHSLENHSGPPRNGALKSDRVADWVADIFRSVVESVEEVSIETGS